MTPNFEEYLQELHGKSYHGTDDDMPDAFDAWLEDQGADDMIAYADAYAIEYASKLSTEDEEQFIFRRMAEEG